MSKLIAFVGQTSFLSAVLTVVLTSCRRQLGGKLGASLENQLGLKTAGDLMRVPLEKLQDMHGKNVG